jgi:carbon-monoxide dehydrogenase medium subunit
VVAICGYTRVGSTDELFSLFESSDLPLRVIAGGTDLLTKVDGNSPDQVGVADISELDDLVGILVHDDGVSIGAATKLADIEDSDLLSGAWGLLAEAAGRVGSRQIRNLGTVGGNLCNASPCADTAPALLVLDAEVKLASARGDRSMPLETFFRGPGETALEEGEILASLHLPAVRDRFAYRFLKHTPRRAMDLSVASVAVLVKAGENGLDCRIAMGSVAPLPMRAADAEAYLARVGALNRATIERAADLAAEACVPISDVRGSVDYRRELVRMLTRRALHEASVGLEDGQDE